MRVRQQVLSLLLDRPNASYEMIGSIVGCSRQRVHEIAKDAGLTRKRRPPHYRSDVTVDKVLKLYHRDLLVKEIAPSLGCCPSTVRSRLREAGMATSHNWWKFDLTISYTLLPSQSIPLSNQYFF